MSSARFLLLQARPEDDARTREAASMRAATRLGDRLDVLRIDIDPLPGDALDRWAGVITGGSPYNVTDPEPGKGSDQRLAERQLRRLAADALARDRPVFFTCYGIGLLTLELGGTVDRSHPEIASAAEERLTDAGAVDPVAGELPPVFQALTGHKESAPETPPGATLLVTNDVSPVQLYRAGSVLASQFHPEPTPQDFVERAAVYAGHGYFPSGELQSVAAAMLRAEVTAPRRLLSRFVEVHGG
ncbi:GMP synthase [Amnibacterium sp. CER49]|uniref:glutamine amidotransferase-related protein n=1 Tax=Amnibacterium sp. CER49 TaxID=3039161 RepID=UPI00244C2F95|nr:GMP synthase [Amnibacterium sp. CER49]MDH2444586.1 GMP synthase [Amnibacterium sp. CER49]